MAYFFMSNTVMAYQRFRHMGCCQNTPQRMLLFQVSRRTDTGKHRCIHITQKESHILLLHGKTRRQLHCCRGFTRSRTSPDCQHLSLVYRGDEKSAGQFLEAQNQILTELYPPEDIEGEAEENEAPDHSDKEPEETKAEEQEEYEQGETEESEVE